MRATLSGFGSCHSLRVERLRRRKHLRPTSEEEQRRINQEQHQVVLAILQLLEPVWRYAQTNRIFAMRNVRRPKLPPRVQVRTVLRDRTIFHRLDRHSGCRRSARRPGNGSRHGRSL